MRITLSKNQWEQIGKVAGWYKTAQDYDYDQGNDLTNWQQENAAMSRNQCGYCESYNCDGTCTYGDEVYEVIQVANHYRKLMDLYENGQTEEFVKEVTPLVNVYGLTNLDPLSVLNQLSEDMVQRMETLKRMEAKKPNLKDHRMQKFMEVGLASFMEWANKSA